MTKQELVEVVDKAERLAIKAHAGQKDKAGKDYFEAHVAVVANGIIGDPIAKAVAFLHDTVEDNLRHHRRYQSGVPEGGCRCRRRLNAQKRHVLC